MAKNRIMYLLAWVSSVVFFCAYQKWFAWLTLVAMVCLPFFSLLISLPAMVTARLEMRLPVSVPVHTPCVPELTCRALLPAPPWKCRVLVQRPMTAEVRKLRGPAALDTANCGAWVCVVEKAKICDYLGLFSFPMRCPEPVKVIVRPAPVALRLPELDRYMSRSWRPKAGGGFAENHELRLYRPGDNIQQIHWKLSAKTGSLILREPMEPVRGRMLLRLDLNGTPPELDRKLGRLRWLGNFLLEQGFRFEIQAMTGNGVETWTVDTSDALEHAVDELLCCPYALEGTIRERVEAASWQYDIGGGTVEA